MSLLDWMNKGDQVGGKKLQAGQKSKARVKQPGDPFRKGDRVVVYETWHLGRELKPDPQHSPGIVSSVQRNGTVVSYEKGGRLPATAATEDVRHATEQDLRKYEKQFGEIQERIRMLQRHEPSWER